MRQNQSKLGFRWHMCFGLKRVRILVFIFFQVGCVCNNSQVRDGKILGLPTEGAMVALAQTVRD